MILISPEGVTAAIKDRVATAATKGGKAAVGMKEVRDFSTDSLAAGAVNIMTAGITTEVGLNIGGKTNRGSADSVITIGETSEVGCVVF